MKVFWVTVVSSVFRTQNGRTKRSHAVPEHVLIPQDFLDNSTPDCFQQGLFQQLQRTGQRDIQRGPAVHQADGAVQQLPDVIHAAPHLGHAPVHPQQAVDGLHGGAYGVLGGEHGVPGGVGELAQEGEVHAAVGDHIGPVSPGPGHEKGGDVGHHGGHAHGAVGSQVRDLLHRHADVVEPLLGDLLSGTLLHGLFHIVAGYVGKEAVHPDAHLLRLLLLELPLAVDGPAQQPLGVLTADDTAGDHLPGAGVPLADVGDIGEDLVVQSGDGGRLPVGLGDVGAELLRPSKGGVLLGDVLPQAPAPAGAHLRVPVGGMVLVAVDGPLGAGAVGDKHQVVLREDNALLRAVDPALDGGGRLSAVPDVEDHIGDFGAEAEVHPRLLQVLLHGQDQGLVLVVAGELQGTEVGESRDVVDKALEVEFHLQGAVPVLEGEHGPPVQPEGGGEHLVVKDVLDGLVVQVLVRGHEELHDLHAALLAQVELPVGAGVPAPVHRCPAQGVVGVVLVEPVELIQHRGPRLLQGGDGAEQVPQTLEVVLHLPATPHHIAPAGVEDAVAGTAGHVHGLQDVDVVPGHLPVPHQEAGRRQGRQAAAHNVGALVLHALRLLRPGKGLIVAVGVIDALAVFLVFSQLRIPIGGRCVGFRPGLFRRFFAAGPLLCQDYRRARSSYSRRCSQCSQFLIHVRYRLSDPAASAGRIHFDGLILLPAKHFFYLQSGPDDQKLIIGPGL